MTQPAHSADADRAKDADALCDHCGFPPESFAHKVRTLHLNTGAAKAAND